MILALSLLATTPIAVPCTEAMARRDKAFRPLAAEMKARRNGKRHAFREIDRYPSLNTQYYGDFENRVAAFDRAYPYRDCKAEQRHAQR